MDIQLQDKTLGQWMEHWAETTPDKEYLVYSDRDLRFTWKEFKSQIVNFFIAAFIGTGIGILPGIGGGTAGIMSLSLIHI